jgi:oligopeptidase B
MEKYIGPMLFSSITIIMRSLATVASTLPPIAKKVPTKIYIGKNPLKSNEFRGNNIMDPPIERLDDYQWLRDETRKNTEVLNHLKAENNYCAQQTKHLESLKNELYNDILSHLKETDDDLPYPYDDYEYYSRTVKGLSYKIHCRRKKGTTNEEIILDENKLAEGHDYSDVSGYEPSPNHSILAYGIDNSGYETYSLRFKDMSTGKLLDDVIEEISGDVVWNSDSNSIFYMKMDDEHRLYDLYMHILLTPQSNDISLFKEHDQRFWLGIDKTHDGKYLIVESQSKETSEVRILQLNNESKDLICLEPRKEGLRYHVESHDDHLFIITNKDNAKNNKVVKIPFKDVDKGSSSWVDVRPYDSNIHIEYLIPFELWMVIWGRSNGLERCWVAKDLPNFSKWDELTFDESLWSVWGDKNMDYKSTVLRLGYASLVSPKRIMEYNMNSKSLNEFTVLKQTEVPSYDPSQYVSHRIYATARDGTKIPISLVHHKNINTIGDGDKKSHPLILYGYGSYGASMDPYFDFKRIPLLDRGIVYAIAHIRGGL